MVSFPPFRVDLEQERLWKSGKEVALRRKPFAVLRYLLANPHRLVTHAELLAQVWNGVVVSESAVRTHMHELRQAVGEGVIETVIGRGYRFTAQLAESDRAADAEPPAPPSMVVGRAAELATLRDALERARGGQRQLCFVTGEPGIGKTTLVQTFLDELGDHAGVLAARGQCIEQYGSPEAYLAVIELLVRLGQSRDGERVIAALARHAPSFLAQVPQLIPDGKFDEITSRASGGAEGRVVRELVAAIEALAEQTVLVVVLEDLQWSDIATIDLVNALHQRRERARLLVIATSRRAEAQTPTHPLNRVARTLVARGGATAISLERIEAADLARFVDLRFPDHAFPAWFAGVVDQITGGTPLFVESLLDDLARRSMVTERDGGWQVTVSADELRAHRPDSVRQLIDIQLDRLPAEEQRLLECAAVVGLEFAPVLVAAALDQPLELVDERCDSLVRRGLFLRRAGTGEWPDGTLTARYAMTHGLVHEVCLTRSAPVRLQRWHRQVAELLERAHAARAPDIAHVLAVHFENGDDVGRAVHYYRLAGDQNAQRFASPDAMRMYRKAHELVARQPATPERDAIELDVLGGLSQATIRSSRDATREPLAMFARMIELAQKTGDTPRQCQALASLSFRHSILAEYREANAVSDQLDTLARTNTFPPPLVAFQKIARMLATVWHADVRESLAVLDELVGAGGVSLGATDRRVVLLLYQSVLHGLAGEPDRGLADVGTAIELAHELGDPYAVGAGHCNRSRTYVWRGGPAEEVRRSTEITLAIPEAAVWHNQCRINAAWADSCTGPLDRARCEYLIEDFRDRALRFPMGITIIAASLVTVLRRSGLDPEALALVDEMLGFARERGETLLVSDFLRVRGELIEVRDPPAAAALYDEALRAARSISARGLELRAATRLAHSWRDTSRRGEGRALLETVTATLTEGAGTADVVAARDLLAALAG